MRKVNPKYEYEVAEVIRISDGDSYWFKLYLENEEVDYGFNIYETRQKTSPMNFRLMYYDTPEIFSNKVSEEHKALGIQAKIFVEEELKQAFSIMVKSHKDKTGKYGRYLAEVFYKKVKGGTYFSIGEELKRNKLLKGDVKK